MAEPLRWVRHDGGRAAAGFRGSAGDCACRAIAIAGEMEYREVYTLISATGKRERRGKRKRGRSNPRTGVYRQTMRWLLEDALGWVWTPTMSIGSGCQVHLGQGEIPMAGRLVVNLSKHYAAVIDGVVYDTHDPCRYEVDAAGVVRATRCVYGYWTAPPKPPAPPFKRTRPPLLR